MSNITDYTQFLVSENSIAQREIVACQNDPIVMTFFNLFQSQKMQLLVDYYNENSETLLKLCPHLAVMLYFTSMVHLQRGYEALAYIQYLKDSPNLPANMYATVEKYISLQKMDAIDSDVTAESIIRDLKSGKYNALAAVATLTAVLNRGDDPNKYNMVYRYLFQEPSTSAISRAQILEMLISKQSMTPIMGDFEYKYRDEPARTITISDDTIAKYNPLMVAANTFVGKIEGLSEMAKNSMTDFLTLYHYANFGKLFPYRSSSEMEIFVFTVLERVCFSLHMDTSILKLDEIPGYLQASAIRSEIDKFFYYFGTDK